MVPQCQTIVRGIRLTCTKMCILRDTMTMLCYNKLIFDIVSTRAFACTFNICDIFTFMKDRDKSRDAND